MTHHGRRGFYSFRRHYAFAQVNDAEYAVMKAAAQLDGLSISDFVRRCVNNYLCEQSDDGLLLEEQERGPRTMRRKGSADVHHDGPRP